MTFKKHTSVQKTLSSKSLGDSTMISITTNNQILFRSDCAEEHLYGVERVELYYDKENNRVGVKPTKVVYDSYKLIKNHRTRFVSAKGFLVENNVEHYVTRVYACSKKNGMLVIDLDNPIGE